MLEAPEIDDDMSEPDSDEDIQLTTFTGIPMDLNDFLNGIEEEDKEMQKIRANKEKSIYSEFELN